MKTKHTLKLVRKYGAEGTNGTITFNGEHICHTIKLPDSNNIQRISCIPIGQYKLEKIRYQWHVEQIGIPHVLNREGILIHAANSALDELQGCIAPETKLTGEDRGDYSGNALAKLKVLVYSLWDMGDEVYLSIR
ncbi:DUF5675 family protein [Sphingobacterium sp. HMA12]|uniref:DUF5675 family protein n=1 Tax=Sphingobacterium sp. HMA12 TaxID=2050894 RepID=UPI000CE9BB14|nr:DUF5675 family protein [Sphingobacterium sp. HMA12]